MDIKLIYFKYQKLVVYFILTLMATQLIYLNTTYGYIHLILYILFLVNLDIYKVEYRNAKTELYINLVYILTVLTLMVSNYLGDYTRFIYYPLILILSIYNIKYVLMYRTTYVKRDLARINDRNIKMFEKEGSFLVLYSYSLILILTCISALSIYNMI